MRHGYITSTHRSGNTHHNPVKTKYKVTLLADKVMLVAFLVLERVVYIELMCALVCLDGELYCDTLSGYREAVINKRS